MPARVVVALNQIDTAEQIVEALAQQGVEAAALKASMGALQAMENATRIHVLVTSIQFAVNTLNGVALARMARSKRPSIKTVFVDNPELAEHAEEDADEFIPLPVEPEEVVRAIVRLLPEAGKISN